MHKSRLNDLSPQDRAQLVRLIQQYADEQVVAEHWNAVSRGIHRDPVLFLHFHRSYLAGLERYLREQGRPEFIPLPAWNPAEPIPEEFFVPARGRGRLRNPNPQINFFPMFSTENLKEYTSEEELGEALMNRHNRVHRRIGGVMNNQRRAPETPVFWVFHSFIDDIWWQWQNLN